MSVKSILPLTRSMQLKRKSPVWRGASPRRRRHQSDAFDGPGVVIGRPDCSLRTEGGGEEVRSEFVRAPRHVDSGGPWPVG